MPLRRVALRVSRVSLAVPALFLLSVYACDDEGVAPPPKAPPSVAVVDAGDARSALSAHPLGDAAFSDGGDAGPPDFYSCRTDQDCVAVPKVGCCANGYLEAVAVGQEAAYRASFVCPTPDDACPHFQIKDTRVAECGSTGTPTVSPKCGLVAVADIRCGEGDPPHSCPDGGACLRKGDAGAGRCKP